MNIFITGLPGCGKSTLIEELIHEARNKGKSLAGITTPEIRVSGQRVGFKIIDLASGMEETMAHVNFSGPKVSKYGVSVPGIDKIVVQFVKSFLEAEIVFIDELGSMELMSKKFEALMEEVLSSKKKNIIALHRALIEKYKEKGKIYFLNEKNKEKIKEEILHKI